MNIRFTCVAKLNYSTSICYSALAREFLLCLKLAKSKDTVLNFTSDRDGPKRTHLKLDWRTDSKESEFW